MPPAARRQARRTTGTLLAVWALSTGPLLAQVVPGGLGTRVNGTALGRCGSGVCGVQGGTAVGRTLFHRFSQFDTRKGIRRVDLDTRGRSTVVVGVSHPAGSFFAVPLRLSEAASLFWLSPGGIWLGGGGQILGATNLLLSTAPTLRLAGGEFNAAAGPGDGPVRPGDASSLDLAALARGGDQGGALVAGPGPIVLAGGRLRVDRHLLLHSGVGSIVSSPEARTDLRAGGDVGLVGGNLLLRGVDIQAGNASAGGGVSLRSGALVGGGLGRLRVAEASLRGARVELEGPGGLDLHRVEVRAGGDAPAGAVRIQAGTSRTLAPASLTEVTVAAGEVFVGANGPLRASNLSVDAASGGGSGALRLMAGPAGDSSTSLLLEGATLRGRTVEVVARGASALRNVKASGAGLAETGGVWLQSDLSPDGRAAPMALHGVALSGDSVALNAAGPMVASDLRIQARIVDLRARDPAGGDAAMRLETSSLTGPPGADRRPLPAERVFASASGDLLADGLEARGGRIQLQAGGLLALKNGSQLHGSGDQSQIQLDALSPGGAPAWGRLEIDGTELAARTITGRANQSVSLRDVVARAGRPGMRGVVRLDTDPPPDESVAGAPPRQGTVRMETSKLEGQWVLARAGAIQVSGSQIEAPKGIIQLDAQSGDMWVSKSRLDVGVRHPLDLRREVARLTEVGQTVEIRQEEPPPAINLLAAGNVSVLEGSALLATQNLDLIRQAFPKLRAEQIRLTDTSGVILVDAGQALRIDNSRLQADATDNLAGDVALRSRSGAGGGGLLLNGAQISASGGAGSGDLRLTSNGGITIVNSFLQALSDRRMEDPANSGHPSRSYGFSGGEITLTNASGEHAITIDNSRLDAEQRLTNKLLPGLKLGARGGGEFGYFVDVNDDADNSFRYPGGIVSILSNGGIQIKGAGSDITVGKPQTSGDRVAVAGGLLRLGNTSHRHGIQIEDRAQLSAVSTPDSGPWAQSSEKTILDPRGRIHLWSNGAIDLRDVELDASTLSPKGNPSLPSIALRSASRVSVTNTSLRSLDPEGNENRSLVCPVGCDGSPWDPQTHGQFLKDFFWGRASGRRVPSRTVVFSEDKPAMDLAVQRLFDQQKTQFGSKPRDWLILPGQPPVPVSAIPATSAPPKLSLAAGALSVPQPPAAGVANPIAWPDATVPGLALPRQAPTTPALQTPLPRSAEAGLVASTTRALSRTDAEQVFASDQDHARQEALRYLAPVAGMGRLWGVASLQEEMRRAMDRSSLHASGRAQAEAYQPAILQISLSRQPGRRNVQINQVLVPVHGDLQGWQTEVEEVTLLRAVRRFQSQLAEAADLDDSGAGRELATVLLGPVIPEIRSRGITALLLSLDRGLQGIPFSALPVGKETLVDGLALTVTPALALTDLAAKPPAGRPRVLLAGTGRFSNGLAPLPMARQELEQLARLLPDSLLLLDGGFRRQTLLQATQTKPIDILHIASHAEFIAGGSSDASIYTSDGSMSLKKLAQAFLHQSNGIGLFVLNACRTAAGDEQRELGLSGLALQAGARSALGNLWYVDDATTAAFSLQFHRYLQQGYRKDQALQMTQLQFRRGSIRVQGDAIINADQEILVSGLSKAQRVQLDGSLKHPYYWAGSLLSGSPW